MLAMAMVPDIWKWMWEKGDTEMLGSKANIKNELANDMWISFKAPFWSQSSQRRRQREDDEGEVNDSDKESMKVAVVGVFLKLKFGINALRVWWIW